MTSQILSSLRPSARRSVVRAALLTLTLSLSHALVAQGPPVQLATADVPFSFSTGAKVLPAGQYTFAMLNSNIYALKQADGTTVQYISVFAGNSPKNSGASTVHFRKYGSSYFLEGAWFASAQRGIELPKGKAEKEMLATNKMSSPSGVVLALNSVSNR